MDASAKVDASANQDQEEAISPSLDIRQDRFNVHIDFHAKRQAPRQLESRGKGARSPFPAQGRTADGFTMSNGRYV